MEVTSRRYRPLLLEEPTWQIDDRPPKQDSPPSAEPSSLKAQLSSPAVLVSRGRLLCSAVSEGKAERVGFLLGAGADPNFVDSAGTPVLHLACRVGHEQIVRKLVRGGADVYKTDQVGNTALECTQHGAILQFIAEKQGKGKERGKDVRTPALSVLAKRKAVVRHPAFTVAKEVPLVVYRTLAGESILNNKKRIIQHKGALTIKSGACEQFVKDFTASVGKNTKPLSLPATRLIICCNQRLPAKDQQAIERLARLWPNLPIALKGLTLLDGAEILTRLQTIACPDVRKVEFGYEASMQQSLLSQIAVACPNLETLHVANWPAQWSVAIPDLVQYCPKLSECPDKQALQSAIAAQTSLVFHDLLSIPELRRRPRLQEVVIQENAVQESLDLSGVSKPACASLMSQVKGVRHLTLSSLSNRDLETWQQAGFLDSVRELDLSACEKLDTDSFFTLAQLPNLTSLKLPCKLAQGKRALHRPFNPVLAREFYTKGMQVDCLFQRHTCLPPVAPIVQINALKQGIVSGLFSPDHTFLDSDAVHLWLTGDTYKKLPPQASIMAIDASYNLLLTDTNLVEFVSRFPRLSHLRLTGCLHVTPAVIGQLKGITIQRDSIAPQDWAVFEDRLTSTELIDLYRTSKKSPLLQHLCLRLLEHTVTTKNVDQLYDFARKENLPGTLSFLRLFTEAHCPEWAIKRSDVSRYSPLADEYADFAFQFVDRGCERRIPLRLFAHVAGGHFAVAHRLRSGPFAHSPCRIGYFASTALETFKKLALTSSNLPRLFGRLGKLFVESHPPPPYNRGQVDHFVEQWKDQDLDSSEVFDLLFKVICHPAELENVQLKEVEKLKAAADSCGSELISDYCRARVLQSCAVSDPLSFLRRALRFDPVLFKQVLSKLLQNKGQLAQLPKSVQQDIARVLGPHVQQERKQPGACTELYQFLLKKVHETPLPRHGPSASSRATRRQQMASLPPLEVAPPPAKTDSFRNCWTYSFQPRPAGATPISNLPVELLTTISERIFPRELGRGAGKSCRAWNLVQVRLFQNREYLSQHSIPGKVGEKDIASLAIRSGWLEVVRAMARGNHGHFGADTLLHKCAAAGETEMLKALLEERFQVDTRGANQDTALHRAAHGGHIGAVRFLLRNTARVEAKNATQRTPLHLAADRGHRELVILLKECGADVNACDYNGETALHRAAAGGHTATVTALLEHGAQADQWSKEETALHAAIRGGHVNTVDALCRHGVDLKRAKIPRPSPLRYAAYCRQPVILEKLIDYGAPLGAVRNRPTPLHTAAEKGWLEEARILVRRGADTNAKAFNHKAKESFTPYQLAVCHNQTEMMTLFLNAGVNRDSLQQGGMRTIHWAAKFGAADAIKLLVDRGADPDARTNDKWTPLFYAVQHGQVRAVKTLLECKASVDLASANGQTPFVLAIYEGFFKSAQALWEAGANVDVKITSKNGLVSKTLLQVLLQKKTPARVRKLLEYGADFRVKDGSNHMPLWTAAFERDWGAVQHLLRFGANPSDLVNETFYYLKKYNRNLLPLAKETLNRLRWRGWTEMHFAANEGAHLRIKCLQEKGADVDKRNRDGEAPIHLAAREGHDETVSFLLNLGARKDRVDTQGRTPLHLATTKGHTAVIRVLAAAGACLNVRDSKMGATPLHYAARGGHKDAVALLLDKGASPYMRDRKGCTPKDLAASQGYSQVAALLPIAAPSQKQGCLVQ